MVRELTGARHERRAAGAVNSQLTYANLHDVPHEALLTTTYHRRRDRTTRCADWWRRRWNQHSRLQPCADHQARCPPAIRRRITTSVLERRI